MWMTLLISQQRHSYNFLQYINRRHDNIQFTIEFEQNKEIPFVDVSVKRQDNIPSQHPFTARKLSLDFILNRTHSHPESTRLNLSERSLIAVSASVPHPGCSSLPSQNIYFRARHVPGRHNILADSLSRLQVERFLTLTRGMDSSPTTIPPHFQPENWEIH